MGRVIAGNASIGKIERHVRLTLRTGLARGGRTAEVTKERLGEAVAAIDEAAAILKAAEEAVGNAWAVVQAEDAKSDVAIANLRDEMWHSLGRPRANLHLGRVFPEGVGTYTNVDARKQPQVMTVLISRIRTASAPQWTKEIREAWAAQIEMLRQTYTAAVDAHRPLEGAAMMARAGYRSAVKTAHSRLRELKRELLNLGQDEAQVHDIIPDASRPGDDEGDEPVAPAPASGSGQRAA
jgi:hypothetical protein